MILEDPKVTPVVNAWLSELQNTIGPAEHLLRTIDGLTRRLILLMDNDTTDSHDYQTTAGYLASLASLHDLVSDLAYPDGDRFDRLAAREAEL